MPLDPDDVERVAGAVADRLRDRLEAPRKLALSYDDAAGAIGVSTKHFRRHVVPRVRVTMSGRRRLVAVRELERYLDEHAV